MSDLNETADSNDRVADARPDNWVDAYAPAYLRPYLRLARWDRPIGTWLLIWPCWWAITLGVGATTDQTFPNPVLLILFAIGAVAMRGAGCTYNDIVDRDYDAKVERTAKRPIPSGQVSVRNAWIFLVFQSLVGLLVLLTLNPLTIALGVLSLALVAAYPFMKRVTYWPQAWLGLTFNWGALMGYTAATDSMSLSSLFLYIGGILWTLGYDTIYAHQDKEDDALIGVKSSALKLGERSGPWIATFYAGALIAFGLAGALQGLGWAFYLGLAGAAAHFAWQLRSVDYADPDSCLRVFKSNQWFGAILFAAILLGTLL